MVPFVGRKKELAQLQSLFHKKTGSLVVIKGRRRIGKSRLVEEFAKDTKFFNVSGLPPSGKIHAQHQRDVFSQRMAAVFNIPFAKSSDWGELFWLLSQQIKTGKIVILFDEISWMSANDPTFLGKLKNAWDLHFKKNPKLVLILCGSISSWIEKNIISNTGFVGRIDLTLSLEPLSLPECNHFFGPHATFLSAHEKFKILSITGGIPRYLESISPSTSAEENIKQLCFMKEGLLYREFESIFYDLFGKKSELYKKILLSLIQYPHASLENIFTDLNMKKSGAMNEYLNDLILAGFLKRDHTWTIAKGASSKLSQFRIADNYVRFYLKYIFPNKDKIERDVFTNRTLALFPGWESTMGLQFENLVLQNRRIIQQLLHIDPNEIVNDNPYFQRPTTTRPGCQIDYLIQTRFNCLYICEIKFSKKPLRLDIIKEMKDKISRLALPRYFSYRPILIHVNGVEDEVIAEAYFSNIIDFASLLKDN